MRSKYHEYKEYHSSADNLQFVNSDQLMKSFELYIKCIEAIEENKIYQTTFVNHNLAKKRLVSQSWHSKRSSESSHDDIMALLVIQMEKIVY